MIGLTTGALDMGTDLIGQRLSGVPGYMLSPGGEPLGYQPRNSLDLRGLDYGYKAVTREMIKAGSSTVRSLWYETAKNYMINSAYGDELLR